MMKHPNRTVRSFVVVGLFLVAGHMCGWHGSHEAAAQDVTINCDGGETVSAALDQAAPGTAILVTGTCMERMRITTDRITLDGAGTAIIDGGGAAPGTATEGVITIESAQGVVLTGLTVQNGPDGILGRRGAAFTLSNITVQDHADEGIQIDENTTADLTDCTVQRSGDDGVGVFRNSSATFRGTIVSNDNGDTGIAIALNPAPLLLVLP